MRTRPIAPPCPGMGPAAQRSSGDLVVPLEDDIRLLATGHVGVHPKRGRRRERRGASLIPHRGQRVPPRLATCRLVRRVWRLLSLVVRFSEISAPLVVRVQGHAVHTQPLFDHEVHDALAVQEYHGNGPSPERCLPRIGREVRRGEKHSLLILTLDGSAKPVNVWAPHVSLPALALKGHIHRRQPQSQLAVAIDSAILRNLSYLHVGKAVRDQRAAPAEDPGHARRQNPMPRSHVRPRRPCAGPIGTPTQWE